MSLQTEYYIDEYGAATFAECVKAIVKDYLTTDEVKAMLVDYLKKADVQELSEDDIDSCFGK